MADVLLTARDDSVLRLTLNRPERRNALTAPLLEELNERFAAADNDAEIRAVLLDGAGPGFCAGQDLGETTPGQDLSEALDRRYNPLIRSIRRLSKPVVCAVHGAAAGAGANLAFACDIVLAGHGAKFLQAFVQIGLIPDLGGTWLLPRLAGDARARGMAMLGEPVDAQQAEAWGLIWRAVPDDALADEAAQLARRLATLPTQSIRLMKQAFAASGANTLDQQLDLERDLQSQAGLTPDFREGVDAFRAKRKPRFTGLPA